VGHNRNNSIKSLMNPNTLEISLLIWVGALAAGFLGSLTGLGGGVILS
jgi:uncharacterized membrane protein YfcA